MLATSALKRGKDYESHDGGNTWLLVATSGQLLHRKILHNIGANTIKIETANSRK